jgi:protein disulfide-isomerase
MSFRPLILAGLFMCTVLALPAAAQTEPIRWLPNIEAAKAEARQSGRFVLVHFWTEDCPPCAALERNVFSQPEVASALAAQFVAVKLNANDNPAIATSMGITRVPTDIIMTPDGEVIGKLISPATPLAYVSEMTQLAAKYSSRSGQSFASAVAAAPQPPQLNTAYAGLKVSPPMPPALPSAEPSQVLPGNGFSPMMPAGTFAAANPALMGPALAGTATAPAVSPAMGSAAPATPAIVNNQLAQGMTGGMQSPGATNAPAPNRYAMAPNLPAAGSVTASAAAPAQRPPVSQQFSVGVPPSAGATAPATAQAPTAPPDPRQLPPGVMPLGFDGYCPVSMRNSNLTKWVPGNPQFGVQHRGRTYWFAGPQEKQQFWANPDYYAPAMSGLDPVMAVDHRQQIPGRREHSIDYDNVFYMFASEASLQQFTTNPRRYIAGVREAMSLQQGQSVR